MHAVVELPGFVAAGRAAGLSDRDRARVIDPIAMRPDAGDVIPGTGGARKVRFVRPIWPKTAVEGVVRNDRSR
jgi:hypothetical protein